jgi:hypothetical protein
MRISLEKRIILLYLPPHCSYILQFLDLFIFSLLKAAYRKELALRAIDTLSKADFVEIYIRIRRLAMSCSNIESGWKNSGIYPLNRDIPLSSLFLRQRTASPVSYKCPNPKIDLDLDTLPPDCHDRAVCLALRNERAEKRTLSTQNTWLQAQLAQVSLELQAQQAKPKKTQVSEANSSREIDYCRRVTWFAGACRSRVF